MDPVDTGGAPARGKRCTATTQNGQRCRKDALPGAPVCATHAGAKVGRPSGLTREVADRIVRILAAGGYVQTAAVAAGITVHQLEKWLARGRPDGDDPLDEPHRELRARIEQARAEGETRNVALIAQAALTNWQAAAWLLERQYPERWARPSQRETAAPSAPPARDPSDPFAEVDELAQRRTRAS